jgi:exodeoxyribonuclease VII small subunit
MTKTSFNYANKKAQLEEIVAWFENSEIDFDEATKKFSEAQKLIAEIDKYLSDKKSELKIIKKW